MTRNVWIADEVAILTTLYPTTLAKDIVPQVPAGPRLPDSTTLIEQGQGVRVMRHTLRG